MKRAYKILALDDERFNLTIIEACLKGNDFEVVSFTDPLPAIKSCRENNYDLLLLDIMLGSISGFEVRKLIREFNARVPIIFLTALIDDFDQSLFTQIYEDYYSYYMNKSFNKTIFFKKIIDLADEYRKVLETQSFYLQIQNDLHMAGEVQKIMLPLWSYHDRSFAASYIYRPCIEVSGDVFRYLKIADDRFFFMLGDISGHGVKSALTMSALQSFIRTMMTEEYKNNLLPHEILNHMNSFFNGDLAKVHYMTCLVGFIDLKRNQLIYQSAGHPDPLFFSIAQQRLLKINPERAGNLPVGLDENTLYQAGDNIEVSFEDNDIFLFYTDGVMDMAKSSDETPSLELLQELFQQCCATGSFFTLPFQLIAIMKQIGFTVINDDITLAVVRKYVEPANTLCRTIRLTKGDFSEYARTFADFAREQSSDEKLPDKVEKIINLFLTQLVTSGGLGNYNTFINQIVIGLKIDETGAQLRFLDQVRAATPGNNKLQSSVDNIQVFKTLSKNLRRNCYENLNESIFTL